MPFLVRWRHLRRLLGLVVLVAVTAIVYSVIPRRADLRKFDPDVVARLETDMWRQYYLHREWPLAWRLYQLSRGQYGYSPLDSLRLAQRAAAAAIAFKDSTNDEEADRALPALCDYFRLIRDRSGERFEVNETARLELYWWKLRRQHVGPAEYSHAIAAATAAVYGMPTERFDGYARLRAQAMDWRDQHDASITAADWTHIEELLRQSFSQLKLALTQPGR